MAPHQRRTYPPPGVQQVTNYKSFGPNRGVHWTRNGGKQPPGMEGVTSPQFEGMTERNQTLSEPKTILQAIPSQGCPFLYRIGGGTQAGWGGPYTPRGPNLDSGMAKMKYFRSGASRRPKIFAPHAGLTEKAMAVSLCLAPLRGRGGGK